MKDPQKIKNDFLDLIKKEYNAQDILFEDVKKITERNLKSFPLYRFNEYKIFNIKYMQYIIGFDNCYNMIIFYSDGRFIEGFIQTDVISLIIQNSEKINLFEKRQKELNEFIKWFKKEYNKRNISNWYNEINS
jgi:hypothetical protein